MSNDYLSSTSFSSFTLDSQVMAGIRDAGFERCTPIQAHTLPIALAGRDVAGQAQTGTGKTAAFLIATFQHLLMHPANKLRSPNQPRALILAPTRELAVQIHRDAKLLGSHTEFKSMAVFGGIAYDKQRQELEQGVDLLIGTPGRLIDYFKQRIYDLRAIQVIVLDEADRMFDLGFIKDVRFLLRRLPPPQRRLGMMFSATLNYRVNELAYEHMNNPVQVSANENKVTASGVHQVGYMVSNEEKIPLLVGLLRHFDEHRAIVFVNTKHAADIVWGYLEGNGFPTGILTGDVPQKKRLSLLNRFQQGELSVLVATDVAARGLHIPAISHVINYDLPEDPEDYVHRIGRTARAGLEGSAISMVCETYAISLPEIEAYIEHKLDVTMPDASLLAQVEPDSRVRSKHSNRYENRKKHSPRGSNNRNKGGSKRYRKRERHKRPSSTKS